MNIGILISQKDYHTECVGFVVELFNSENNQITVYHRSDERQWIQHFCSIYHQLKTKPTNEFVNDNNDILIKLSEDDTIELLSEQYNDKTINLIHNHCDKNHKFTLSLSPFLRSSAINAYKMTPVYDGGNLTVSNENTILFVGLMESYYFTDDLKKLIKECNNYKFIVIGRSKKTNLKEFIKTLNLPNLEVFPNVSTNFLIDYVKKSKFILCRRYPFQSKRFSGAISLGITYGKPLIIQRKYNDGGYNAPGIMFDEFYDEIIDNIKNMSNDDYNNLANSSINFCNKTKETNKVILGDILNKINNV